MKLFLFQSLYTAQHGRTLICCYYRVQRVFPLIASILITRKLYFSYFPWNDSLLPHQHHLRVYIFVLEKGIQTYRVYATHRVYNELIFNN